MIIIIKKIFFFTFVLFLLSSSTFAQLENFEWLVGKWKMEGKRNTTIEIWNNSTNSTFEGSSNTISKADDRTVFSESLRIIHMDSEIFYLAKVPENEFPIPFKIVENNNNSFTAENPSHDFPQRIVYSLTSADSLIVNISRIDDPASIRIFAYKRN